MLTYILQIALSYLNLLRMTITKKSLTRKQKKNTFNFWFLSDIGPPLTVRFAHSGNLRNSSFAGSFLFSPIFGTWQCNFIAWIPHILLNNIWNFIFMWTGKQVIRAICVNVAQWRTNDPRLQRLTKLICNDLGYLTEIFFHILVII